MQKEREVGKGLGNNQAQYLKDKVYFILGELEVSERGS